LSELERALGHRFEDPTLLVRALTHRSASADHNERLEFLGDAVLSACVSSTLVMRYRAASEGELTRVRAQLVREESLHRMALGLSLPSLIRLSEGEARGGGAQRVSILADAVEALIGAVYLDAGYPAALAVVQRLWAQAIDSVDPSTLDKDPKTELQERLQARRLPTPDYRITATRGRAHAQTFEVACNVPALQLHALGQGASRRAAEQAAAQAVLAQWTLPAAGRSADDQQGAG
jgi:ribonuclease III